MQSIIKKHKAFWEMEEVERPLIGYCFGGWSQFQQYPTAKNVFPAGPVKPEMLKPELFLEDYEKILKNYEIIPDDLIHAVEPLPFIPWMEAIMGCSIYSSGSNIWSEPFSEPFAQLEKIRYDPDSPWVRKYREFINFLNNEFGNYHPVGQAILRGPADMMAAAMGDEKFLYALYDKPDKIFRLSSRCAELHNEFLEDQLKYLPEFHNGYVIGQYHIWAPGKCIRLQEDAGALLSPDLYKKFFWELDRGSTKVAEFNLLHIHTTSLFLLDLFLGIRELKTIQVSLDVGGPQINEVVDQLNKIQNSGKRVVIKGNLNESDILKIKEKLNTGGLCLQIMGENYENKRPAV